MVEVLGQKPEKNTGTLGRRVLIIPIVTALYGAQESKQS